MNIERNDSVPEPSPTAAGDRQEPRRSRWPWLLALAAVGVTIFLLAARGSKDAASADKSGKAGGKSAASARAVPVIAATARKGDVGVYLSGLGTVTSLSTVTVRSRVDGQLVSVGFQEGQHVKEGDLLAQID
ncbi:MAG TPA: biotin/lipoyl-binding protein, partial [Thermoanaerobaculia bacterium]|nr:biotin/lipoyl-binding protein [Thermoanaerobaculia bacterium]